MTKAIAINNPILDMMTHISYSQKVVKNFWVNVNTTETQARGTWKAIDKRMEFLEFNLKRMVDLPKMKDFNRTEATATALYLDKLKQTFSDLEKSEIKEVLFLLEPLRK